MKVTKYIQSCMVIEKNGTKILIDPGDGLKELSNLPDELKQVDAIFYTHQHADHYDEDILDLLTEDNNPKIYANESHATIIKTPGVITLQGKDVVVQGEFKIRVAELEHCLLPDGSKGPQNIGYIVDEVFFHPGDGKEIENETIDILALPITGPDVSMKDAFAFAEQVGAKTAIPIHYDKIGAYPQVYKAFAERFPFSFTMTVLESGESLSI